MKKNTIRLSAAGPQAVRDGLKSRLMQGFVFLCVCHYALLLAGGFSRLGEMTLTGFLIPVVSQGFVTAECLILYQRKESKNLRHLAVYCLIAMTVMLLLFLVFGALLVTLNAEYNARTQEIMQLWTEADLSSGMPWMIAAVVSMGLAGAGYLCLWKALGMCAQLLEGKGSVRNWLFPAALLLALQALLNLAMTAAQPGTWMDAAVNAASIGKQACLAALLWQGSRRYTSKGG